MKRLVKVKAFDDYPWEIENLINHFLEKEPVTFIDIKYQVYSDGDSSYTHALLIYEELEE